MVPKLLLWDEMFWANLISAILTILFFILTQRILILMATLLNEPPFLNLIRPLICICLPIFFVYLYRSSCRSPRIFWWYGRWRQWFRWFHHGWRDVRRWWCWRGRPFVFSRLLRKKLRSPRKLLVSPSAYEYHVTFIGHYGPLHTTISPTYEET